MDRVKFGRALGYGARHAAKALTQAVDAATTPAAGGSPGAAAPRAAPRAAQTVAEAGRNIVDAHRAVTETKSRVQHAAKMGAKSALAPVAKFSSVLWLEVTGTFFGMVALVMGEAVWKLRGAVHVEIGDPATQKLYAYAAVFLVFVYFSASSFVRAWRRQRR